MSAVALFRDYELPWTPSEEEQRRLRRILGAVLNRVAYSPEAYYSYEKYHADRGEAPTAVG